MLLTELHTYLYHNAELPHRGDGALFHYTKFSSFLKNMEDMTLLPSSFVFMISFNSSKVQFELWMLLSLLLNVIVSIQSAYY